MNTTQLAISGNIHRKAAGPCAIVIGSSDFRLFFRRRNNSFVIRRGLARIDKTDSSINAGAMIDTISVRLARF
jgi:hypothetical protein